MRLAQTAGGVLGVLILGGVILLMTRGTPKPQPRPKNDPRPVAANASAGVQDAFAFAKDLEGRLRSEPKFARVYLVPSAATASHKQGKVVVMGDIDTEEDLRGLQSVVAQGGIPITLEWQVSVQRAQTETPGK